MATPISADKMVKALRNEGLKPVEKSGWTNHNRNHKGDWGPVNGIIIHHTAGTKSLNTVWAGRSDLPGPLAHAHLAKDGTLTLTGNGRTNHAGLGDSRVLAAVIGEKTLPKPTRNDVDGNARFYGIEIENLGNGKDAYPVVQYVAAVKWAAAICREHGWSAKSVIGHKEWTNQKTDPSFSMTTFRKDVQAHLDGTCSAESKPPTKTPESTSAASSVLPGGPYFMDYGYSGNGELNSSGWASIPWTTEYDDSAELHTGTSEYFGQKGTFNGAAYFTIDNLTPGEVVQVRAVEVDSAGASLKYYPIVEGLGTSGSTFIAMPMVGFLQTGRRLKIQILPQDPDNAITLASARVSLLWTIA